MSITWLPLSHRKNISSVKIVYEEDNDQPYGGHYTPQTATIVVVVRNYGMKLESIIAHEFRHHTQRELRNVPWQLVQFDPTVDYNNAIRKYFRSSWSELDALVYENKYAKCDYNEWWLKELVDDKGYCKRLF